MTLKEDIDAKNAEVNKAKSDVASGKSIALRLENIERILGLRD